MIIRVLRNIPRRHQSAFMKAARNLGSRLRSHDEQEFDLGNAINSINIQPTIGSVIVLQNLEFITKFRKYSRTPLKAHLRPIFNSAKSENGPSVKNFYEKWFSKSLQTTHYIGSHTVGS